MCASGEDASRRALAGQFADPQRLAADGRTREVMGARRGTPSAPRGSTLGTDRRGRLAHRGRDLRVRHALELLPSPRRKLHLGRVDVRIGKRAVARLELRRIFVTPEVRRADPGQPDDLRIDPRFGVDRLALGGLPPKLLPLKFLRRQPTRAFGASLWFAAHSAFLKGLILKTSSCEGSGRRKA
jgi:hypothetical protein